MRGIVLAGGSGTRLYPLTLPISKQLLPVYDKPMIYYPLSVLMLAGIREILIITTQQDQEAFQCLLGNGSHFGVRLSYMIQASPDGLAQALILAENFLQGGSSCLVLGDNIFYGQGLQEFLLRARVRKNGATLFAHKVRHPQHFGVVEFQNGKAVSLEEKPDKPRSHFAVTGLYFYDSEAPTLAKKLIPSARGELEITDLNQLYLDQNQLHVEVFGRGFAWFDTGTQDSLLEAAQFVQTVEHRQGFKIACLEEIAVRQEWVEVESLQKQAVRYPNSTYSRYLEEISQELTL
jgi:glucose-1-phosphate thymidylyltransferase